MPDNNELQTSLEELDLGERQLSSLPQGVGQLSSSLKVH